jgi:hypothetical protein
MLDRIKKFLDIIAPFSVVLWLLIVLALPKAGQDERAHFILFLVRQSTFDVTLFSIVAVFFWLVLRSELRARAGKYHVALRFDPTEMLSTGLRGLLLTTLVIPLFFIVRARAYFWRDLTQISYAAQYRDLAAKFSEQGRPEDAYRISSFVFSALKGTPQEDRLRVPVQRLGVRVRRSRELAGAASTATIRRWNPIRDRRQYFEIAEAVRVNPQRIPAAEALRLIAEALPQALEADAEMTCGARRDNRSLRTLSRLEWEIRQSAFPLSERTPTQEVACRESVYRMWKLQQVKTLLQTSEMTELPSNG